MGKLFLYNTLTRKKELFKEINKGEIGLYTCGPTVYNYAHIGNLRAYLFEDILKRSLIYNGYKIKHVMNITDVGHLTGDRDMGEDKLEKGAKREGKTAWEIAKFYEQAFKKDIKKLNILEPDVWCRATENIPEQIDLIKKLEEKGYTYKTSDGIYFDTSKFKDYTKLSHLKLEDLKEGARVEANPEKRNAMDFALWKFSNPPTPLSKGEGANTPLVKGGEGEVSLSKIVKERRQMEWWFEGKLAGQLVKNVDDDIKNQNIIGFPGWHIECSAMSMKFLGEQLDIHCGGIDHINIHHTNEIAQSEAATGKKFFNYWLHGAFLNIAGGKKMAKSEENFLTLENALIKKEINPLAFRYAVLSVHYRKPMEYSEEAIINAERGLEHLHNQVNDLGLIIGKIDKKFKSKFLEAVNNDLNMPKALAVAQELLKSNLPRNDKRATILSFDEIFGLELDFIIPKEIIELGRERQKARKKKDWDRADELRKKIEEKGYIIKDFEDTFGIMGK